MHGDETRHAAPLGELAPHEVAGALGGDHRDVDLGRRVDLIEVDREAVREQEQVARRDAVPDLLLPDLRLFLVREQDHHDVAGARGVGHVEDPYTVPLGIRAARRVGPQPDDDVDSGILQVQRVGMTLGAVAEHGHGLALEQPEVGVTFVKDVRHGTRRLPELSRWSFPCALRGSSRAN